MDFTPDFSPYQRIVNYYETDKMAIVHHSNYIRYMEEARLSFMKKNGLDYAEMERNGIIIPVTFITCKYFSSAKYDSELLIYTRLMQFTGVRFALQYDLRFKDGTSCAAGESEHCFLFSDTNRPISLKRRYPAEYERFCQLLNVCNGQN